MNAALNVEALAAASAAYYSDEWPFGDVTDPELHAVIASICTRASVRRWFDLGSGPIGPLWLPFIRPRHAILTDVNGEHLCHAQHRVNEIRSGRLLPVEVRAALHAATTWGDAPDSKPWAECEVSFASLDLERLQFVPPELQDADLVTAIGSLGCLSTMEKLDKALFWLGRSLFKSRLVTAFWMGSEAQQSERYAAWPHLYYGDCVARVLTPDTLVTAARRNFSHVTVNVLDLGGGRQLCMAEMQNPSATTSEDAG